MSIMQSQGNELNGAEAMVRLLQAHGVKHIFGLCGDTSLPFYDALYRLDHGIEHIDATRRSGLGYQSDQGHVAIRVAHIDATPTAAIV